jgi:hypothetical protein
MNHLQQVRTALLTVFGDIGISAADIEDATYTGREDPGGWARRAEVVIHTESGIPSYGYELANLEAWERVDNELREHGLFTEPVNAAVIAVYRA